MAFTMEELCKYEMYVSGVSGSCLVLARRTRQSCWPARSGPLRHCSGRVGSVGRVATRQACALGRDRGTLASVGAVIGQVLRGAGELLVRVVGRKVRVGLVLADWVDPSLSTPSATKSVLCPEPAPLSIAAFWSPE